MILLVIANYNKFKIVFQGGILSMQEKGTNKWTLMNVITLAIFSVIIFVIMTILMIVSNILFTPVGAYFIMPGIAALFAGPFYMVMTNKISKRGVLFFLSLISGLLFLAMGQVYTFVIYIILGVIGELCMWGQNAYQNFGRNLAGFFAYMLALSAGGIVPMLLFRKQYLTWYSSVGNSESLSAMIQVYGTPRGILTTIAITAIGSVIGCVIGRSILTRHVKKARI